MNTYGIDFICTFLTATLHKPEKSEENNEDFKVHPFKLVYTLAMESYVLEDLRPKVLFPSSHQGSNGRKKKIWEKFCRTITMKRG
jgi:hypothetical protein